MMTVLLVIAVAIATISVILLKKDEPKTPMSFYESMKLVKLPIVTFKIGDEDINFMLDSGGMRSFIDSRVVDLFKLPHEASSESIAVYGITGNTMESRVVHMTMHYKDMEFKSDLIAQNLEGSMDQLKEEYGVRIHGMLGADFFEKYKYVLDFKNMIAYSKK